MSPLRKHPNSRLGRRAIPFWAARCWAIRLVVIGLGLSPWLVLEVTLRALDLPKVQRHGDPFLELDQLQPLFQLEKDGVYRIPKGRHRLFAPQEFPRFKGPKVQRIFALGGSTTQGEPWGPATSFAGWLQLRLQEYDPEQLYQVVNTGGLSYASYRVLPILDEILHYEPDLVLIYCGQNEYLESRELAAWRQVPEFGRKGLARLASLRSVQWISQGMRPAPAAGLVKTRLAAEVDALLDYRGGLEKYRRDLWDHQAVAHSFAWNIEQMLIRCRDAGVPVVLMTPVANLRDCPPFKFELPDELSQEQRNRIDWLWDLSQRQRDQPELAVSTLRELLSNDSDHAGAHYYLGQLLLQHQEWDVALEHLERAKDLDVCPLRATSLIQSAVRHLAKRYGDSVWHVDVDQLFRDQSPHGIVGRNWLVDHVHPSIEGHQEIASAIHRRLIDRGWGPAAKALRIGESSEAMSAALNQRYRRHLHELGEHYFQRGKQRMEGLMLWTQGRAKKVAPSLDNP